MAATAAAAPAAAPPTPARPRPAPPPVPEQCRHKNRLQQFVQRNYHQLPSYLTETEGQQHELKFRCIVQVGNERFSSTRSYNCRKDAEQDAARVAYEILMKREEDGGIEVFGLIDQDVVLCKSILHEFAVKTKTAQPSYSVTNPEGSVPVPLFIATVLFDGNTYTGEVAKNKKDAEQKAARAAIKTILGTKDICLLQIIRGKKKHITASGSQETHTAPTNTLPPVSAINFTPPVTYEAYGTPQFAYTSYGKSHGTLMQSPYQVPVLNAAEPLQGGPTQKVPVSQAGFSFPISTQGPNIIPAPTQLVPVSQAGSASPIAVQGPNIIPAPTCFPVSQVGSESSILVEGHSNAPSPTPLVPVLKAEAVSPITFEGPKLTLEVDPSADPSVQVQAGSKKRKKTRRLEATEERAAQKH